MRTWLSSSHRRMAPGDDGIAMVTAIALVGVVGVLILSMVAVAMVETRATGRDRQRSNAVMTAEQEVDLLIAQIQSTDPTLLPCADASGTYNLPAATTTSVISDELTIVPTVTYFLDSNPSSPPLACADVLAGSVEPQFAAVKATSTSDPIVGTTPAVRTIETLLQLTPVYGDDLDKAIFGNDGVTIENNGKIRTVDGELDADIYSNGDFECDGNQEYMGSVHVQGSVSMSKPCVVAVDVHAVGGINANHPSASVNGRMLSSTGSIQVGGHLGQYARAAGTATGSGCVPADKCVGGVVVGAPKAQSFPQLAWNAATQAAWAAEGGFTHIKHIPDATTSCQGPTGGGDKDDAVGAWVKANASSLPANTVVVANCPGIQMYQSGIDLALNKNLAIFSTAGVKLTGNPTITSTVASQPRHFYLIQPYGAACAPNPGVYLGNQVSFTNSVNVLIYSPCDVEKRNQSDIFGQIYAGGEANLSNKTEMWYEPLPVWNVMTASTTVESYDVDILYKRENV